MKENEDKKIAIKDKHYFTYFIIAFFTIVLIILMLWHKMFITVHAGKAGVLFKRWSGTDISNIYKEGFYIIPPWHLMYQYNTRIQEEKHEFGVLSKQGLTINIKISIRFKPDVVMLGVLHQRIGPDYIQSVVVPEIESIIRKYFGQFTDEELYTSKKAILKKIFNDSKDQLASKYIILDDIIIRHIKFPEAVEESIQSKIREFHKFKEYEYRIKREELEAKRKVIEANGIKEYKNIISENITKEYLEWKGIDATLQLAKSDNSKVVIIGSTENGLPLIFNSDTNNNSTKKNIKSK
jgi:regulator of protease activity HflC (stomatin/prohibitin superfamily)